MKRCRWHLTGVIAAAAVLAAAAGVRAETCTLELKRVDSPYSEEGRVSMTRSDYLYRATSSQGFFMQISARGAYQTRDPRAAEFSQIVTKEPAEYGSPRPFRGVADLGSEKYAFVLDSRPSESAEEQESESEDRELEVPKRTEVEGYSRLFFDLNHNGDLTDDKVIEAVHERTSSSGTYVYSYFPRVDVTIRAGETNVDYAFLFSVYLRKSDDYSYASASLDAAAYREGKITLDGKTRHLVLVDFNSNGRFDDACEVTGEMVSSEGYIYPRYGDMLLVDPDPEASGYASPYDPTTSEDRQYVAKLINIDGRFYDMEVTPAGDKLTLTPSSVALGHVTNPNAGFRALVYGDRGVLKISGGKSEPVALPEGEWKLLSYTIDQTGYPEEQAEEEEDEKEAKEPSLLEALASALLTSESAGRSSPQPRYTLVSARGTKDSQAVKVGKGETVPMPFGPPYRPVVKVAYRSGGDTVPLGMSLVGSAGEICSNLYVDGRRPGDPQFTISTADGEEVQKGKFEYG